MKIRIEDEDPLPPITRSWSGLKVLRLDSEASVRCIADGVERGMFPSLVTVMIDENVDDKARVIPSLFKLYKANIPVLPWEL